MTQRFEVVVKSDFDDIDDSDVRDALDRYNDFEVVSVRELDESETDE